VAVTKSTLGVSDRRLLIAIAQHLLWPHLQNTTELQKALAEVKQEVKNVSNT
jgi:hypothetical protein